jgi:hypothetical protein
VQKPRWALESLWNFVKSIKLNINENTFSVELLIGLNSVDVMHFCNGRGTEKSIVESMGALILRPQIAKTHMQNLLKIKSYVITSA